jgi:hypothetical protein
MLLAWRRPVPLRVRLLPWVLLLVLLLPWASILVKASSLLP